MTFNLFSLDEREIILKKGTEIPFAGEYDNFYKEGVYICKQCNNPLYSSKAKFDAGCGWPAFDDCFPNSIKKITNKYDERVEIQCAHCDAHLGHIFEGEKLTTKNTRHCVNSLSIKFVPENVNLPEVLDF